MTIETKLEQMLDKLQRKDELSTAAVTGEYDDVVNKVTKTSELTNNADYQTSSGHVIPKDSGVTSGTYGQATNKTITVTTDGSANVRKTIGGSGSFTVPYFTVDKTGRITSISNKTITLTTSRTNNYANYYNYSNYMNYGNYNNYSNYTNYSSYANQLYANYPAYASYPSYWSYYNCNCCNCTP